MVNAHMDVQLDLLPLQTKILASVQRHTAVVTSMGQL